MRASAPSWAGRGGLDRREWRAQGAQGPGGRRLRRVAVNPDIIRAQVEGGIGYATGHILYGEVPLAAGRLDRVQLQRLSLVEDHGDAGGRSDHRSIVGATDRHWRAWGFRPAARRLPMHWRSSGAIDPPTCRWCVRHRASREFSLVIAAALAIFSAVHASSAQESIATPRPATATTPQTCFGLHRHPRCENPIPRPLRGGGQSPSASPLSQPSPPNRSAYPDRCDA